MPTWDVFISHASEDKPDVVLPLAKALERAGLTVWLDRQELTIGDSLHQKIDEGLANSSYGIVVLSPSFLAKQWPKRELDGLFTAEDVAGRKLILPVWHNVDRAELVKYSPILAGRLAGDTRDGIPAIAKLIIEVVTAPGSGAPADVDPSPRRRLVTLLDRNPNREEVVAFLASYPAFLHSTLGTERDSDMWSVRFGDVTVDVVASRKQHTTREVVHWLVLFGPAAESLLVGDGPSGQLDQCIGDLRTVRHWIGRNLAAARAVVPDISPSFSGVVITGRRDRLTQAEADLIRELRSEVPPVTVRTYDWIIGGAAEPRGR